MRMVVYTNTVLRSDGFIFNVLESFLFHFPRCIGPKRGFHDCSILRCGHSFLPNVPLVLVGWTGGYLQMFGSLDNDIPEFFLCYL